MPLITEEGQMETIVGDALKGLFATAATQGRVSDAQVKAALHGRQPEDGRRRRRRLSSRR